MPVRKIPKNYRSVTGTFPSLKNNRSISFESTLERDFYLSLEFDNSVASYEEQPLTINGNINGCSVSYTPDCLAQHIDDSQTLFEVKYTTDLEKDAEELAPRFDLAKRYVREHDIAFCIVTELDIRCVKLDNQRFLYAFSLAPKNLTNIQNTILNHLNEPLTLESLLLSLSPERIKQAAFIPAIWHLVFTGALKIDIDIPITNKSIITVNHGTYNY